MHTIFLSSTFNDMQRERDAFHNIILPRLNRVLSNYGSFVGLCDLRWGVDTSGKGEEEGTLKILDVCFDSIRSASPFFVVMLGERYGWVPDGNISEKVEKNGIEYRGQSVTEMEIEYYNLQKSADADRAIYLFRQPIAVENMNEESRKIFVSENTDDRLKLERLKEKIRKENPGRVFSYSVQWDENTQSYSLDEFTELVCEKLELELIELLGTLPIMTDEEKTLNESKAYFEKRASLCAGNADVMVNLFKDMLGQIRGNKKWANEELREMLQKAGKLESIEQEDGWDPFRSVLVRKEGEESTMLAGIYGHTANMELSRNILAVPFVAGVNEYACNGQHLLDCIIRALEIKFLQNENTSWKNGSDMRQKAMKLIEFKPWGRYPVGTVEGRRYYLERLLNYARIKRISVFLFVQHLERLTDTFARELQFLTATGADNRIIYMFLETTDNYYKKMSYIRSMEGSFTYKLKPLNRDERKEFINNNLALAGKSLPADAEKNLTDKKAGSSPAWLKNACEILVDMDEADFEAVRKMGDGIEAIDKVLTDKISNMPEDTGKLVCNKILRFAHNLNKDFLTYICQMLSITEYGVSQKLLEEIANDNGINWSSLDFEVFVSKFSMDIRCNEGGLYSFYDESVRNAVFEATKPLKLLDIYTVYLKTLTCDNEEFYTECISSAARQKDADRIWEIADSVASRNANDVGIFYRFSRLLEDDCRWLVENVKNTPSERSVKWFCKEFYRWLDDENRVSVIIPVIKQIAEAVWCPQVSKMLCHSYISENYDRGGKHSAAAREFDKAFEIAEKIRGEYPVEALDVIGFYCYLCTFYRKEQAEFYAKLAYSRAMELSHTEENFLAIVYACCRWLRVFEEKESVKTVNDRYQQIFELFEEMGNKVCFDYDGKYKRDFFYKIKLKYVQVCMNVCDRYASFLAKNRKQAEGIMVPCHTLALVKEEGDGDFYTQVKETKVVEETDFATASVLYRGYAIKMAAVKYNETHNVGMLEYYADCSYRQARFMKNIGRDKHRNGEAYEFFETSASAYENALKAHTGKSDIELTKLYCADAYAGMGEVAENFTKSAYSKLSADGYSRAYNMYSQVDLDSFSQVQLRKFSECCIKLSAGENGEDYRNRALEIMKGIEKASYSLYYNYYVCYKPKTDALLKKTVSELTADDVITMSITAMLLANCFFYGADSQQAVQLYTTNKSVMQSVAEYLGGMQNPDAVIGVYKYIRGFYFEYCYHMAKGNNELALTNRELYIKGLAEGLLPQQIKACADAPLPEGVIDYIRKKG